MRNEVVVTTMPAWVPDLLRKVEFGPADACWDWTGAFLRNGRPRHGNKADGISSMVTHRLWYLTHGSLPPAGAELHHRCRHPWCVNPYHLEPLVRVEHSKRHRQETPPSHCRKGHALDKHTLGVYERPDGRIRFECKQCGRERMAAWKARQTL
jgi:hypothetical protein